MRDTLRETFLGFIRVHLLHHAANERTFGSQRAGGEALRHALRMLTARRDSRRQTGLPARVAALGPWPAV